MHLTKYLLGCVIQKNVTIFPLKRRGDISTFETWEEPLRTVEDALDNPENPYLYYYANGPLVYRRKKR